MANDADRAVLPCEEEDIEVVADIDDDLEWLDLASDIEDEDPEFLDAQITAQDAGPQPPGAVAPAHSAGPAAAPSAGAAAP